MTRTEFIKFVAKVAQKDWVERKICLPSVVIAQAIKESGGGTSELAVNANAIFGIKQNGWTGPVYYKVATEQNPDGTYKTTKGTVPWRKYNNWEESIIDHNTYIATRYVDNEQTRNKTPNWIKVVGVTDYKKAVYYLQSAKYPYSTSLTYETSIINDYIIKYNLTQYDNVTVTESVKPTTTTVVNGPVGKKSECPFLIQVLEEDLEIRKGASTLFPIAKKNGAKHNIKYTIVDVSGNFGKLKSGAGWISIHSKYVKRV